MIITTNWFDVSPTTSALVEVVDVDVVVLASALVIVDVTVEVPSVLVTVVTAVVVPSAIGIRFNRAISYSKRLIQFVCPFSGHVVPVAATPCEQVHVLVKHAVVSWIPIPSQVGPSRNCPDGHVVVQSLQHLHDYICVASHNCHFVYHYYSILIYSGLFSHFFFWNPRTSNWPHVYLLHFHSIITQ